MHRGPPFVARLLVLILALVLLKLVPAIPARAQDPLPVLVGTVTKIVDGDTIDVQLSSGPIRVRLHGVDTPERGQPWGKESTAALTALVMGKEVDIEPFSQDRYERMIGIVFLGDLNVNLELVKRGHAWAYRQYMRTNLVLEKSYVEDKTRLERCARDERARLLCAGPQQYQITGDRIVPGSALGYRQYSRPALVIESGKR